MYELGLGGSLRQWWQEINRYEKQKAAQLRADRKARDEKRRKCCCKAYPWPHRPGGGLCRLPNPPLQRWQPKPNGCRVRYAGIVKQIARANGLHPIRDRATIQAIMPGVVALAKQAKRRNPRVKYRNMEITENGISARFQTAGPMM